MNKKFLIGIFGLFAIVLVLATVSYYAILTVNLTYDNPIDISGELVQDIECEDEICMGDPITILNSDDDLRILAISDDSPEEVTTSYLGSLVLTEKVVDFNEDVWEIPGDADEVEVIYTLVGDEFVAWVEEGVEGYELIYYKDNSDRFDNPAEVINVEEVEGNLPYETDGNVDEYDYCETNEYLTCHGAKIWYVPSDAINQDGSLDWSRASEFYYETELIQFSDGQVTVYPSQELQFTPQYEFGLYAEGDYTIETTIA